MKHIFYKPVDKRSRKAMTDFLTNHQRYWTMNSWNRLSSYANCVKIYRLDFPEEIEDKLTTIICNNVKAPLLDNTTYMLFCNFFNDTGFFPQFNGRSDGYLVMHDACLEDGKIKIYTKSVDDDLPYDCENMSIDELRKRTNAVQSFDKLCDKLRQLYIDVLSNYDIYKGEINI